MSAENQEAEKTVLQSITELLRQDDIDHIDDLLQDMHPADIAHLLESLPGSDRQVVWQHVADDLHGETLIHLNEEGNWSPRLKRWIPMTSLTSWRKCHRRSSRNSC